MVNNGRIGYITMKWIILSVIFRAIDHELIHLKRQQMQQLHQPVPQIAQRSQPIHQQMQRIAPNSRMLNRYERLPGVLIQVSF